MVHPVQQIADRNHNTKNLKNTFRMGLRKKFDFGLVKLAVDSGAVFSDGKALKNISGR